MSKREVVITTIYCEGCPLYEDPQQVLEYPNCDNAKVGWVRCGAGNTVKRNTGACSRHPAKHQERVLVLDGEDTTCQKVVETVARMKPEEKGEALLGGMDFAAKLKSDIEVMARKVSA